MSEGEGRVLQLNDSQRSTLQSFQEIASIDDEYLCMQILQQNNWDLNLALSQFLGHAADENAVVDTTNTSRTEGRNVTRRARGNDSISNNRSASNTNVLIDTQPNRARPDPSEGAGGLFGLLFVPLRWLFQARPLSLNPEQDTQKFIDEYNMKLTTNHPNFHAGSYQSAVATAYERSKFLLVYLHSPLHEDTPRFCRDTLASSSVITYANENLITWTGRVWDPEAYNLSTQLRATTFPFVALLICQSNRTVQIADRMQGYVEENIFMERVQRCVNMHMSVITQNQREAQRREEAVRLRAQQDREYHEAAEADRLAVIRQREEAAEREIAEEEARQAAELEAAQELSRRLTEEDTLRKLRAMFEASPEPAVGPTVSAVRFQLPSGKKLSRRFGKADTVQRLFDYLTISFSELPEEERLKHFSVCTHFPKVELTDMNMTIEQAGLHPRGMLYVQDLDA